MSAPVGVREVWVQVSRFRVQGLSSIVCGEFEVPNTIRSRGIWDHNIGSFCSQPQSFLHETFHLVSHYCKDPGNHPAFTVYHN